ncbi:MAG: glycosyltransferase family 4 protein [Patescibacteria group bacterium]
MKIVFLQDDFPPQSFGGAGISTFELAQGMYKAGQEVFVITTCRKESDAKIFDHEGIRVFRIATTIPERWRSYRCLYNRQAVREVERILSEIKPDVVHVNNVHTQLSYYCLKIARRHAKAVIFTARDVMTFNFAKLTTKKYLENFDARTTWRDHIAQAGKRYNPLRNWFIKRYLRYADKIFAISKALQKALSQNGIKNVEVIYNGIDVENWNGTRDSALKDKKVILFGGRLSEAKGGEKTVEALAQIVKGEPRAVLLVAGKIDEYAETMKKKAQSLGIADKLIFTGWIDGQAIKNAYASADVVLMPSICFDAFGRVNIEAMASKKPVVGTCYGGTPEVVVDGVTGYIVNPLYPEQIAQKTLDLLKNPAKAGQFGRVGYERVKVEFNLDDKVKQYLLCYKDLLARRYNPR